MWYKIVICYHACPPVCKIIHSLKLVDYVHVQEDNPWYNCYIYKQQLRDKQQGKACPGVDLGFLDRGFKFAKGVSNC